MNHLLSHLYTSPAEAVCELHARRAASTRGIDNPLELHLASRPCAVLFRQVATPNFELERFVSLATSCGLTPLVLEFHRDKFVTRNAMKYALGRMGFYAGIGRNGGARVRFLPVVDLPTADGSPLEAVTTVWRQPLVEFHHELLQLRPQLSAVELCDASKWFASQGPTARHYYTALLALFVQHAILFESFLLTPAEQQFTSEVVLPAFEAAEALHGQRPLICRLDPAVTEGHAFWLQYPDDLYDPVATSLSRMAGFQSNADSAGASRPTP